jgi:hypothetical protein
MSILLRPKAFFVHCRSHYISQVMSLGSLQRRKSSSTFCIEARQTCAHLNSNRLVDQSGYSSGPVGVSSYRQNERAGAARARRRCGHEGDLALHIHA